MMDAALPDARQAQSTRRDVLCAQKVEVGIVFQTMLSSAAAAAYLFEHNVPLHVAHRVLLCGDKRRAFCVAPARDFGCSHECHAEAEANRFIRRLTRQPP